MKYYCKNCGSILIIPEGEHFSGCPVHGCNDPKKFDEENMVTIPDYETPEQYDKRTGKHYSGNGLVFWLGENSWFSSDYNWVKAKAKLTGEEYLVVIADPPIPPPDDWSPA